MNLKDRYTKVWVLFCACSAWLLSCFALNLVWIWVPFALEVPRIPYVAMIPWIKETDFFSRPGLMGIALLISCFAVALVEMAKACLTGQAAYRVYPAFLVFQAIVGWAAFSNGSPDWAAHFQSLILTHGTGEFRTDFSSPSPRWPWLPLVALPVLFVLTLRPWRIPAGATPARSRLTPFSWVGTWDGLGWLGLAWLVGDSARQATHWWFPPSDQWPHMGNVAAVPWVADGEPQSTTVQWAGTWFFSVLAVLLVEIVKAGQIRRGRGAASYWPLLAFQVVLFCDVFASAAPDWAAYALSSVLGAAVPMEAFPSWPWISLLALFLLVRKRLTKCTLHDPRFLGSIRSQEVSQCLLSKWVRVARGEALRTGVV